MNPGTLVIRADASVAMGTGHVMRCLALAQAWQDVGGDVIFTMAESTPAITRRLRDEGMGIAILKSGPGSAEDAIEVAALADEYGATWIVVDGYQFDSAYQRRIKKSDSKLLLIDDAAQCAPYSADIVLNQNAYAELESYRDRRSHTMVLLGPHYALLREEFTPWRSWQRQFASVAKNVLVTMGGSDSQNISAWVVNALRILNVDCLETTVAIGGSNTRAEFWKQFAAEFPGKLTLRFDTGNMAELMAGADLAISAAGTSCYELALLQVPMVLVTAAENQSRTGQALANGGAAINAGWFDKLDPERFAQLLSSVILSCEVRCSLGQNARRFVDGYGTQRVCQLLLSSQPAQNGLLSGLQVGAL